MKLFNVIILNGVSVLIRILTLLGINKAVAIYTGPSSFALISQLQNVIAMALVFPSNAINGATVKLIAANKDNEEEIQKISQTSSSIIFFFAFILGVLLFVFCKYISLLILKDDNYAYVIRIFAISIFFFSFNSFLLSLINGKSEHKKYIISNIAGNIITLFLSLVLIFLCHIDGALIALVTNQVFNLFATVLLVRKTTWFKFDKYIGITKIYYVKSIMHYSLMPIFAAMIMPISLTVVRNFIISEAGWNDAGVWDALWKMSNVYLMLITMTLNIYLLPKLASLFKSKLILQELFKAFAAVCIIMTCVAVTMFFFKDILIKVLFTNKFLPVSNYIMLQVFGDTLKMFSWIIAYYMLSKARVKKYIFCESVQWGGFIVLCFFLNNENILERVMIAHITSQVIYLFALVALFIPEVKRDDVKL